MLRYFCLIFSIGVSPTVSGQKNESAPSSLFYGYFHNPIYMDELASVEFSLYKNLKEFASSTSASLLPPLLRYYLQDFEESSGLPGVKSTQVTENPNLFFRTVWRFVKYIVPLTEEVRKDPDSLNLLNILVQPKHIAYPNLTHLESVVTKLAILQVHFDLKPREFMRGEFKEIQTGVGLTFQQSLFIANVSIHSDYFYTANDWLDFLEKEKAETLPKFEKKAAMIDINNLKRRLISLHDSKFEQLRASGSFHIYSTRMENATSLSLSLEEDIKEWMSLGIPSGLMREKYLKNYAICRNSSVYKVREPSNYRKLKCYLEVRDPYFLLQPVKKEVLSKSPDIFLYHDVLRDSEISFFYEKGKPIVLDAVMDGVSPYAWFNVDKPEDMPSPSLSLRMEKMVDLNLRNQAADDFRFTPYDLAISGNPHHDAVKIPNVIRTRVFADRAATMLTYISNVELGGQTLFVDIPLLVQPVKGSMLYWEHYASNGKILWTTYHGVCPPVLGRKLLLSSFIGFTENSFVKRSCTLDPNE